MNNEIEIRGVKIKAGITAIEVIVDGKSTWLTRTTLKKMVEQGNETKFDFTVNDKILEFLLELKNE